MLADPCWCTTELYGDLVGGQQPRCVPSVGTKASHGGVGQRLGDGGAQRLDGSFAELDDGVVVDQLGSGRSGHDRPLSVRLCARVGRRTGASRVQNALAGSVRRMRLRAARHAALQQRASRRCPAREPPHLRHDRCSSMSALLCFAMTRAICQRDDSVFCRELYFGDLPTDDASEPQAVRSLLDE
jgi:hypothetical protein